MAEEVVSDKGSGSGNNNKQSEEEKKELLLQQPAERRNLRFASVQFKTPVLRGNCNSEAVGRQFNRERNNNVRNVVLKKIDSYDPMQLEFSQESIINRLSNM